MVPPACANTHRMLGYRAAMPLSSRLTIVRVVCVPYSIDDWLGTPGTRFSQQGASWGCVKTTALRRFSSSYSGANIGSPCQTFPYGVRMQTPSAFSTSKA